MPESVMPEKSLEFMRLHLQALYLYDAPGRLTGCNQFDGGAVPRFHLGRTAHGTVAVYRSDVPRDLVAALEQWVQQEPSLSEPESEPVFRVEYETLLAAHAPIEAVWQGPVYRCSPPTGLSTVLSTRLSTGLMGAGVVDITGSNAHLLESDMPDWLIDVGHRQPFVACVESGKAVAVCASARMTDAAHEAGVETAPGFRRRGFARQVVEAWAAAVSGLGAETLYSTSWENLASRSVARALDMTFIGTDYHVR